MPRQTETSGPTLTNSALWAQLENFNFDAPNASMTFAQRLALENGWSRANAQLAISEYLRFIYLIAEAGHPVTPSPIVDQVWHLHMTYTRSYWDDLCGRVIGRPLHHEPTKGGAAEDGKFRDWYGQTLRAYWLNFGKPNEHVWPETQQRFAEPIGQRRWVDRGASVVVRKRALAAGGVCAGIAGAIALFAGLPWAPLGALAGIAAFAVVQIAQQSWTPQRANDASAGGCSGGFFGGCGGDGGGGGCGGGCGS